MNLNPYMFAINLPIRRWTWKAPRFGTVRGYWTTQVLAMAAAAWGLCLVGCQPTVLHYEVASSSMAPTLPGPSLLANCQHCQHAFLIAADTYRAEFATRCSQCGGRCQVAQRLVPGRRVDILPKATNQAWERFELVAFEDPANGAVHVKRIWGLPGEAITLRQGEAYIATMAAKNPRMLQKSLAQLQSLCIPVSNFPDNSISHWYLTAGCPDILTAAPTAAAAAKKQGDKRAPMERIEAVQKISKSTAPFLLPAGHQLQWRYQRPAPVHTDSRRADAAPASQWLMASSVVDDYEVNQGVSCQLHPVDDYLLQLEMPVALAGELRIVWRRGSSLLPILFQPPGERQLDGGRASSADPRWPAPLRFAARRQVVVAWCDQRLLVATDCEQSELDAALVEPTLQPIADDGGSTADPEWHVQLQASQALRLTRMLIARDLYFEDWQPVTTNTAGYFVLGDNLAVSIDSRSELGRIAPPQIVGRVSLK